jgi:hypothetical protein
MSPCLPLSLDQLFGISNNEDLKVLKWMGIGVYSWFPIAAVVGGCDSSAEI